MPRRTATKVHAQGRATTSEFDEEVERFLHSLTAENRSDRTTESYGESLGQLSRSLAAAGHNGVLADLQRRDIERFLIELKRSGRSENTVAIRYRSLRAFFNHLVSERVLSPSPMAGMPMPKVTDVPPDVIAAEDLLRLFRGSSGTRFEDRRDLAILQLFYDTGMRLGEMANIELNDVDLDAKVIRVDGKTGPRTVPFESVTRQSIDRYLRARYRHRETQSDWFWLGRRGDRLARRGISQMVKRRAAIVGLKIHPHQLRHSWADSYLSDGPDGQGGHELDAMRLGGWRSLDMVSRYGRSAAVNRALRNYRRNSPVNRLLGRSAGR